MVKPMKMLRGLLRRRGPDTEEAAGIGGGRDITRGFVDHQPYLYPLRDRRLRATIGRYDTYENMLRDDRVHSTLEQRRSAVVAREMEVVPGDDRRQSKKAADYLSEVLKHCDWDDVTDKMLYGVFYGYSVAECLWARDGRTVFPDQIRVRDRRRFVFDEDFRPRLLTHQNPQGEELPERKFWTFCAGADHHDEPYGVGLGWHLYWPVWFKRNQLKFWLVYLEKFGMPTAVGKYGPNATAAEKRKLLQAAQAVHGRAAVTIPDDMVLELLQAIRGGTIDYEAFYQRMQSAITTVVLSQTMTTDDGSSLSQAEVHMEVRKEIVESDDALVCGSFNRQVAAWLTAWNFPNAAVPIVRRIMDDPPDTHKLAERDKNITEMGPYRPTRAYLEETYNIELEDEPEPESGPGPRDLPPREGLDEVEMAELGGAEWSVADALDEEEWTRIARPLVEPILDLAAREDARIEDLAELYPDMDIGPLTERLARALFTASVWGRLRAEQGVYADVDVGFAEEDVSLAYALKLPPRRVLEYFRGRGYEITWDWHEMWQADHARAFTVAKAARLDVLSELRDSLDRAIEEGQTLRQFSRELAPRLRKLGWWGVRDGVQLGSWNRLRTIFDTNMRVSYSAAHYRAQIANKEARPYWQYHQIQRDSKRDDHAVLHLKVFRADDPIWDRFYPPNGWSCGCWIRALTEAQVKAMGLTVSESEGHLHEVQRRVATDRRTGEEIMRDTVEYRVTDADGETQRIAPAPEWAYNPGQAAASRPPPSGGLSGRSRLLDRQPTWSQQGLPAALPVSAARPARRNRAEDPLSSEAARADIYDALEDVGGERIEIVRDDGRADVIFGRVRAPADLDDVMMTGGFVEYVARKGPADRRVDFADFILPSLRDPSEVWLRAERRGDGRTVYRRAFLTAFEGRSTTIVAQEDTHGWLSWTMYPERDINRLRRGYLLYRRPDVGAGR